MKTVSVIIPCHNSLNYLPECLKSLESQTIGMEALEIILVDDASTDQTWELILEFEQKYPESVTAIQLSDNLRQGGARNAGIHHATGTFLAFLDSDDWIRPETYLELSVIAEEHQLDLLQFNHWNVSEGNQVLCDNCKYEGVIDLLDPEVRKTFLVAEIMTCGCWNKLYRRSMTVRSGAQFAEHCIYEEPLFVYPQFFFAERAGCIRESYYSIRQHAQSTMHKDAAQQKHRMDHPSVQLQLYRYFQTRTKISRLFTEEMEYYFLKTYYVQTLYLWAREHKNPETAQLEEIRKTTAELFPGWRSNRYVRSSTPEFMLILDKLEGRQSREEWERLLLHLSQI